MFRYRAISTNGLDRRLQHVLMMRQPAFAQLHEADRFKRQCRRSADFRLTIDLRCQLPCGFFVGTDPRSSALPILVIVEIPDAAAQIGPDLREMSATGFWCRREFFSNLLDCDYLGSKEFRSSAIFDEQWRDNTRLEHRVLDILATDRFGPVITKRRKDVQEDLRQRIRQCLKGYTGWLVTNPTFRVEIFRLQLSHSELVHGPGDLPTRQQLRRLPIAPRRAPNNVRAFRVKLSSILNRWALDGLTTWNLPDPVQPGLFTEDEIPTNGIFPTGLSMFVPWPLLVDQNLKLREMADYYRSKVDLRHLEEWITGERQWGFDRFGRMLDIYVYSHLGLVQRYGDRLGGLTKALDRAFAAYWETDGADEGIIERGAEGVCKIRQKMNARLRRCRTAMEHEMARIGSGEPIWPRDDDSMISEELAELQQDIAAFRKKRLRE